MRYAAGAGANKDASSIGGAARGQFAGGGQGGVRGARNGGGMVGGEIISKDNNGITVKLRDGGSKIIFLTENTPITKSVGATLADLQTGSTISAEGTPNADGSLTARSLQIRPAGLSLQ